MSAVGAFDDRNTINLWDDRKATNTSQSSAYDTLVKPDVFTPGTNIIAPLSPNSTISKEAPGSIINTNYISLSRTSMDNGICSGAAAVILQCFPTQPNPRTVKIVYDGNSAYPALQYKGDS